MRYKLLGPLEVWEAGHQIRLSGQRERRLLAALAVDGGRVISADRLVRLLWDDEPPVTATKQIHNSVAKVRRTLSAGGLARGTLAFDGQGYRLAASTGEIDASLFGSMLGDARSAKSSGALAAAADLYQEALALWRGPALDGIDGRAMRAIAAHLDEQQLTAVEEFAELRLRIGRHREVVDDLVHWTAAYPLHEALLGQLMLALYRCGRAAEALAMYRQTHRRLVTECGTEPGLKLRDLHNAILRDGPALALPVTGPAGTGSGTTAEPARLPRQRSSSENISRPAQLPRCDSHFTGRRTELAALRAMLSAGERTAAPVVVVSGAPGMGKTALALQWAHELAGKFHDGQLYVDLRGYSNVPPAKPLEVLSRFLSALGVAPERIPQEIEEATGVYRTLIADRKLLVVLDNAASAAQLRPLLPSADGCLTIVTSRNTLTGLIARDGARHLRLGTLAASASRGLLASIVGVERVIDEPKVSAEIAALCGQLPLALRIAAADLVVHPAERLSSYRDRLRRNRLSTLCVVDDDQAEVAAAFQLSYMALPPACRQLFRLLGLACGPDVTVSAAAALAGQGIDEAASVLAHLTSTHLVDEYRPGRYRMHDLLRAFAVQLVESEDRQDDRDAAVDRWLGYYLVGARHACKLVGRDVPTLSDDPQPDSSMPPPDLVTVGEVGPWLDVELPNLLAAMDLVASGGGNPRYGPAIAGVLGWSLCKRGDWQLEHQFMARALAAAELSGDERVIPRAQLFLGRSEMHLARYAAAARTIRLALAGFRASRDQYSQAAALADLGQLALISGDSGAARQLLREALEAGSDVPNFAKQRPVLHYHAALIDIDHADWPSALDGLEASLQARHANGDRTGTAGAYLTRGAVLFRIGRPAEALASLSEALTISRELGTKGDTAQALNLRSAILHSLGQVDEALDAAMLAVDEAAAISEPFLSACAHWLAAVALRATGSSARAQDHHERATVIGIVPRNVTERLQAEIVCAAVSLPEPVISQAAGQEADRTPGGSRKRASADSA